MVLQVGIQTNDSMCNVMVCLPCQGVGGGKCLLTPAPADLCIHMSAAMEAIDLQTLHVLEDLKIMTDNIM